MTDTTITRLVLVTLLLGVALFLSSHPWRSVSLLAIGLLIGAAVKWLLAVKLKAKEWRHTRS